MVAVLVVLAAVELREEHLQRVAERLRLQAQHLVEHQLLQPLSRSQ